MQAVFLILEINFVMKSAFIVVKLHRHVEGNKSIGKSLGSEAVAELVLLLIA